MHDLTPYEVFCKLIGDIRPHGDVVLDKKTYNNLDQFLFCLRCLTEEAASVLSVPFYGEASVEAAIEKTKKELKEMADYILSVIKEETSE